MSRYYLLALSALILILTACTSEPPRRPPPPVLKHPPPAAPAEPEIRPYIPPDTRVQARPKPARAVAALMSRAQDQRGAGNLVGAVGSLERAVRIAPRDPEIWNRLAHIRLEQRRYSLARELASKSIALSARADTRLKADNWMVISRARRATGDVNGARAAEARARGLH